MTVVSMPIKRFNVTIIQVLNPWQIKKVSTGTENYVNQYSQKKVEIAMFKIKNIFISIKITLYRVFLDLLCETAEVGYGSNRSHDIW